MSSSCVVIIVCESYYCLHENEKCFHFDPPYVQVNNTVIYWDARIGPRLECSVGMPGSLGSGGGRPYDYDDYLIADGSEVKRARHTQTHCSPFRAQIGTIAASLPTSGASSALMQLRDPKDREAYDSSPFAQVGNNLQLSSGQLESYLRAEAYDIGVVLTETMRWYQSNLQVRYLKRRHLIPHRTLTSCVMNGSESEGSGATQRYGSYFSSNLSSGNGTNSEHSYREAPLSPNNNSGSESEGEINVQKTSSMKDLYEKPQFSLKQVMMICERLLKQQEVRLRYEYETVLNQRLEDQHEQYVQFAREQIERQHQDNGVELSYLS
ncbi:hypothetical protein DINM_006591 [Dirofilaria immitis]|nr:hypothetical protein [Dirofilaria immitis]